MGLAACQVASALSYTYGFNNITGKNAANAAAGVAQLSVEVGATALDSSLVDFTFRNSGPAAMSITQIYWADGTLLGIASITDSGGGVAFSPDNGNLNLPGGNTLNPAFNTTQMFGADADPPVQRNGVNPGEWATIRFRLKDSKSFADTLDALNGPLGDGNDLRIGIHVQGFANGGSESFVNRVPDGGATAALLGLGLLGLGFMVRRRA